MDQPSMRETNENLDGGGGEREQTCYRKNKNQKLLILKNIYLFFSFIFVGHARVGINIKKKEEKNCLEKKNEISRWRFILFT
jgi:hypothetical protein